MRPTTIALATLPIVAFTPALAAASSPSRASAARYAHRTYINDKYLGKRSFALEGRAQHVRASDGSRITAWHVGLADSGDGSGEAVLLFRGRRFLGWASDRLAIHVGLSHRGTAIKVRYGVYTGTDPFCCPHRTKIVRYRWKGARIVASAKPPRTYGRYGPRLHLARR